MRHQRRSLILWFALVTLYSGCALVLPSKHRTEDYTPVFAAATGGDLATVREAVDREPSLLRATEWDNATLLHDAVGQTHRDIASYLLDKGADVNAVTKDGLTPLHMAAQNGDILIITLLVEPGRKTKINPVDSKGWTPLDRALKWGHPDAAELLRQHGAHEGTSGTPEHSSLSPYFIIFIGHQGKGDVLTSHTIVRSQGGEPRSSTAISSILASTSPDLPSHSAISR